MSQGTLLRTEGPTDVAWSAVTPELLLVFAGLTLMLMAIAGRRRAWVVLPAVGLLGGLAAARWAAMDTASSLLLAATAVGFLSGVDRRTAPRNAHATIAFVAALAAAGFTVLQFAQQMSLGNVTIADVDLQGAVAMDGIAFATRLIVTLSLVAIIPLGSGYLRDRGLFKPETLPMLLFAAAGMTLAAASNDFVTLFVAYEVFSVSLYILTGIARRDRRSSEAGVKYLLLGAATSAFLLFGIALLYGATGTMQLDALGVALPMVTDLEPLAVAGLAMVLVGLGFKAALAPFHLWVPDVYQGAPTPITAFMAAATKATAFAILARLIIVSFDALAVVWMPIIAVLGAATMLVGALGALRQDDLKRILAYSSVAHAGYASMGLVALDVDAGLTALLWYLLTYAIGSTASFGALIAFERARRGEVTLKWLAGAGAHHPFAAIALTVGLLSLAGIPLTVGFLGKATLFLAVIDAGWTPLVLVAIASSVIAAAFYLRIVAAMFLANRETAPANAIVTGSHRWALAATTAFTLALGVVPASVIDLIDAAAVVFR